MANQISMVKMNEIITLCKYDWWQPLKLRVNMEPLLCIDDI